MKVRWLTKMSIDVLLLSGGNDIGTVPKRDLLEKSLLFWAEKYKKPVLGLCRGMQMMGVYFGSELIDVKGHVCTEHQLQINNNIEKMFLTASGGPFHSLPLKKFKSITISQALKHPNWKMGKKISVDSANMMNKVFEVIEAKKIFNIWID